MKTSNSDCGIALFGLLDYDIYIRQHVWQERCVIEARVIASYPADFGSSLALVLPDLSTSSCCSSNDVYPGLSKPGHDTLLEYSCHAATGIPLLLIPCLSDMNIVTAVVLVFLLNGLSAAHRNTLSLRIKWPMI